MFSQRGGGTPSHPPFSSDFPLYIYIYYIYDIYILYIYDIYILYIYMIYIYIIYYIYILYYIYTRLWGGFGPVVFQWFSGGLSPWNGRAQSNQGFTLE